MLHHLDLWSSWFTLTSCSSSFLLHLVTQASKADSASVWEGAYVRESVFRLQSCQGIGFCAAEGTGGFEFDAGYGRGEATCLTRVVA